MANSSLTQRQIQPNNSYHCKDCGVYFDSIKSLDVHLHYHKENLLSKWATQSSYAQEESNNNSLKNGNNAKQRTEFNAAVAAPADSSDAMMKAGAGGGFTRGSPPVNVVYSHPSYNNVSSPFHSHEQQQQRFSPANGHPMFTYHNGVPDKTPSPANPSYHGYSQPHPNYLSSMRSPSVEGYFDANALQQQQQSYPDQFSSAPSIRSTTPSSVSSPSSSSSVPGYRYHPYQQQHTSPYGGERGVVSSSSYPTRPTSPQQCEKCGTLCDTGAALAEHLNTAHPPTPVGQFQSPPRPFDLATVKSEDEPQAEILDLDSHKVHVYQPPEEEAPNGHPHSVSAMLWGGTQTLSPPDRKPFHPMGRNPTPDFGVTSTLTSPQPEPQSYQQQRYRDLSQAQPQQPITSTQVPSSAPSLPGQPASPQVASQPSGKNNASWKSNEARRPKTYNCSACNKWFTSSGHLKRHYNTTLHKNAVKQSGQPDPASLPVNAHHHPDRDPTYAPRGSRGGDHSVDSVSSPVPSLGNEDSSRSDEYGRVTPMMPLMQNGGNLVQMMTSPPTRLDYDQPPQAGYMPDLDPSVHRPLLRGHSPPPETRRSSPPPHQLMQPHMMHPHPHPVALLTSAQMEQQMMQTYPNAQPPHVITNQTPQVTNTISTNQTTSIGNMQNSNINCILSDNAIFEELQPLQHFFGNNNMFQSQQQQQLPSFAQFNQQNYSGQVLSMLQGFNSLVPPPSYSVTETDHVGGLSPSPPNPQTLLMESYHNNNNYISSDVTSLSDDHKLLTSSNYIRSDVGDDHKLLTSSNYIRSDVTSLSEEHKLLTLNNYIRSDVTSLNEERKLPTSNNYIRSDVTSLSEDHKLLALNNYIRSDVTSRSDERKLLTLNNYIRNDVTSLSEDHKLLTSSNYIRSDVTSLSEDHKMLINSNSDSSGSLGEEVLSPIGTPDCPTSTISGDFDTLESKPLPPTDDTLTVSSTNESMPPKKVAPAIVHKCIDCDKVFNKACYLTQHNKSFHSGAKPYKCNRCGKRFLAEYQYEEHLLKHAPDKPYKCEICPKQFNHKTDLRRHMCLHTGEKPYSCETCGKGFIRKDHMLKHCITHRRKISLQQQQQHHQIIAQ